MLIPGRRKARTSSTGRARHRSSRLAFESLEDRALLAPFTVGGDPSVNPADFRITTFVSGLNYPGGMLTLSDGSLLVGVSNPVGGTSYFNSVGELLRFTDTNGDGVADSSAGEVMYNGLPGDVTALSQAGEFILATSSQVGSERISVLPPVEPVHPADPRRQHQFRLRVGLVAHDLRIRRPSGPGATGRV